MPNFGGVRYPEVYPGIDLIYHAATDRLEFDFIVKPGADYRQIRIHFDNIAGLRLAMNGDLIVATPAGELCHQESAVYQQDGDKGTRWDTRGTVIQLNPVDDGFLLVTYAHAVRLA